MLPLFIPRPAAALAIDYHGAWLIEPKFFAAEFSRLNSAQLAGHVTESLAAAPPPRPASQVGDFDLADGVAVVDVSGVMMKRGSSLTAATSTIETRRAIRQAAADPGVSGIVLRIESPGGTFAGTRELVADVEAAAKEKPIVAYIEDLGASAAYWLASAASLIIANETALVGSIGTYATIADSSQAAEAAGVKVHLITTGAYKGAATPGTEISAEQLAEFQRTTDQLNEFFLAGIEAGRGIPRAELEALADGRVFIAADAVAYNLIDRIGTIDDALAAVGKLSTPKRGPNAMDHQQTSGVVLVDASGNPLDGITLTVEDVPTAASYKEIAAALPAAEQDFIAGQLQADATTDQARDAFAELQAERINQAAEANATLAETVRELKTQLAAAETALAEQRPGGEAIGNSDDASSSPAARRGFASKIRLAVTA